MIKTIKTNNNFDKLTNLDISTNYRDNKFYFMKSDFMGAFAYWVVVQSPYDVPDIRSPLTAFSNYIDEKYPTLYKIPELFSYDDLKNFINADIFESIPEIKILNKPKISSGKGYENRYNKPSPDYDFIGLSALAGNVFFMILREAITQNT